MARGVRGPATLLAFAIAAVACSSGGGPDRFAEEGGAPTTTSTPTTFEPVDSIPATQPCDVLSAEAAGAALGLELVEGERLESVADRRGCEWITPDGERVAAAILEVGVGDDEFVSRLVAGQTERGNPFRTIASTAVVSLWVEAERATLALVDPGIMVQVFLIGTSLVDPAEAEEAGQALLDALLAGLDAHLAGDDDNDEPPVAAELPPAMALVDRDEDPPPTTYLQNLHFGVEEGRWTLGEGYVRTLEAVLGQGSADTIDENVDDFELTGLIAGAQRFVAGTDSEEADRVAQLLRWFIWPQERLDAMVVGGVDDGDGTGDTGDPDGDADTDAAGDDESAAPGSGIVRIVYTQESDEPEADPSDCEMFSGQASPDLHECLFRRVVVAGDTKFLVYGPDPTVDLPEAGWTEDEYTQAAESLVDSVATLTRYGRIEGGTVLFSAAPSATGASAAAPWNEDGCDIIIYPDVKSHATTGPDFKQVVAHEVAHCLQGQNVEDASASYRGRATAWLVESMAEYLSNRVYPDNNLEIRDRHMSYLATELTTTLFERSYENASWAQHFANTEGGPTVLLELLADVAERQLDEGDQGSGALRERPDAGRDFHAFVEFLTDGLVADSGEGFWPPALTMSTTLVIDRPAAELRRIWLDEFSIDRWVMEIPAGHSVSLGVATEEEVRVTIAPWEDTAFGVWQDAKGTFRLRADCDAKAIFGGIATSTGLEPKLLIIDADEVTDECEDSEPDVEPPPARDPECIEGSWSLETKPFLQTIKRTDRTRRDQKSDLTGSVTATFAPDGVLKVTVTDYKETHDHGDGRVLEIRSSGTFDQTWSVENGKLQTGLLGETLNITTTIDGGFLGEGDLTAPPEHVAIRSGPFLCTEDRLTIFFGDGFISTWSR